MSAGLMFPAEALTVDRRLRLGLAWQVAIGLTPTRMHGAHGPSLPVLTDHSMGLGVEGLPEVMNLGTSVGSFLWQYFLSPEEGNYLQGRERKGRF